MNETNEKMLLTEETLELDTATKINSDADILFEDSSKRSENTKHFRLKNGHYMAAVYDKPVHFKDPKSGEFKDLADRFSETEDFCEADTGRFKARFPKKDGKAKFVSVERDGMSVSWRYLPKNTKRKNPEAMISRREKKNLTELLSFPRLRYEKEDTQTDLEYGISDIGIKENIILSKCPKNPIFRFELKTEGVKAVLADDKKSVNLFENNAASGTPVFVIPPITLFDATGMQSDDAHYELSESEGVTVLSVCVNPEWLSATERLYPVTVDPQVTVTDYGCPVSTLLTVRSDGNVFHTKTPKVCVGIDTYDYENNLYAELDFSNIPHNAVINRARMGLLHADYLGSDNYNLYRVTTPWTPENISWTYQPQHASTALDSLTAQARGDGQVVLLDVTEVARNALYGTAPNYGVVMKRDLGTTSCNCSSSGNCNCPCNSRGYMQFYTSLYDDGNYGPLLQVEYSFPDDYADHGEYETFEAGLSGEAGINLSTGQLTYRYEEVALSGGKLPLSFSHIFQSFAANADPEVLYGRGWFPATMQTLEPYTNGGFYAIYRDGQGKKHYFNGAAHSGWYGDSDGVGLLCNAARTQVKDEKDNVMTFENGKLKTLTDAYYEDVSTEHPNGCGSKMTFDYDSSGNLQTITDSMGRVLKLYYTNGRLSKMDPFFSEGSLPEGSTDVRHYAFTYNSSGKLIKITHPHEGSAAATPPSTSFAYDGNRLVMISDTRGICHTIGYDEFGRVTSVRKTGTKRLENGVLIAADNAVDGGGMDITYYDSTTVVKDSTTNVRTVYRFDDCGHTTCSYEDLRDCASVPQEPITATQLFEYKTLKHNTTKNDTNGCYASLQAAVTGTDEMHPNYLTNGNFSDAVGTVDPDKWIVSLQTTGCCGTECKVGGSVVNESFFEGYKSYKFDNTQYRGLRTLRQEVDLRGKSIDGNMMIASAWVKAIGAIAEGTSAKFHLYAKLTYKNGASPLTKTLSFDSSNTDWQHLAIPLEIPEGEEPSAAYIQVNFTNNTGTCLVSNVRLTETRGMLTNIEYCENPIETMYFTNGASVYDENGNVVNKPTVHIYRKITANNGREKTVEQYDCNNDKVIVDLHKFGQTYTTYILYDGKHQVEDIEDYKELFTQNEYTSKGFKSASYVTLLDQESDDFADCRISTEPDIDENTGLERTSTDACGSTTEFTYDTLCRTTKKLKSPYVCNYEYNSVNSRLKKVYFDEYIFNEFNYHPSFDSPKSITQNAYEYTFDYNLLASVSKISAGGVVLEEYNRTIGDPCIVTTTYAEDALGNKKTVSIHYDAHGNPTKKQINGIDIASAAYDSRGNVRQILDKTRNLCYNYIYNKDGTVKEVSASKPDVQYYATKTYTYDAATHRLEKTKDFSTDLEYRPVYKFIEKTVNGTTTYRQDPEDTVVGVELVGKFTDKTETDPIGRSRKRTLTLASETAPFLTDTYDYKTFQYQSGHTSALAIVGEQKQEYRLIEDGETSTETATWYYSYDAELDPVNGNVLYNTGNIKTESGTGIPNIRYTYDSLNRLTLEERGNTWYEITYDNYGNILTKDTPNSGTYTLGYGAYNGWKDLLTSINGNPVTYDDCRNPINYRNYIFEWSNIRQLTWCRIVDGDDLEDHTFVYGADGIRCQKDNIYYTRDGDRILSEHNDNTGKTITYLYGEKGVVGFTYNGADYYYRKNLHDDVLAIYNTDGEIVAEYEYDAWGKVLKADNKTAEKIADINPIRYRSYYYDVETGFYYLNSRYYDPEIGRFLNADTPEYLGDGSDLNNYNLFAYCGNNPVMYSDPTGHIPFFILTALALGTLIGAVGGLIANHTESNIWAGIGLGFAVGAIVGAAIGMAMSYYWTGSIASEAVPVFNSIFHSTSLYRSVSPEELLSIKKTKKFGSTLNSMDGKFFAKTKKGAIKWGNYWDKNYAQHSKQIKIRLPKSSLKNPSVTFYKNLDTFDDAFYFSDLDYLNSQVSRIWFL